MFDETRVQSPPPPFDVVLEIVERSDPSTVVRCAATCKLLRRPILGEDFRRRLALRAAANGGFDPTLLGVSYRFHEHGGPAGRLVQASGRRARFDESLLESFTPAASRDGILVLRKHQDASSRGAGPLCVFEYRALELLVCNTLTGHTSSPPSLRFSHDSFFYPPALLTVNGAGCSFELLVVDRWLQKYWLRDGKWVVGRVTILSPGHPRPTAPVDGSSAAVTGKTAHWLCHRSGVGENTVILSIDTNTARATVTELPHGCIGWQTGALDVHGIHLAG
ncbi:hypothetical protein E2562_010737 [Oryza meyeriana var. granulata]|uniref:DUF7595 domain-containing protein n=1 Tax=Oryza meyeriana var. granulata TaxID=110450 RepID=A0A6G1EWB6_9ORYZ|nr:hypothetical protein E2562_010737 [Oryza meyeriana var. granulata]